MSVDKVGKPTSFVAFYNEDDKKWEVQEPVKSTTKKTASKKTATKKSTAKKTAVKKNTKKA